MTEFLHQVVEKRERTQRNRRHDTMFDEIQRQMQEYYSRSAMQATIPASNAVYATEPSRTDGLTTIYGRMAVRSRSANQVDEYIRQNMTRHGNSLAQENYHTHEESDMQWVLEEVSASGFIAGLLRRQFTYSCSLCGQRVICPESVPREAVVYAG